MTVTRRSLASALSVMLLAISGCAQSRTSGPYAGGEPVRDPQRARELHTEASEMLSRDPKQAEVLLRQALDADLYHGPSHNNLGVLLLKQGKLYEAAGEFEWARKLMPGHPDPRVNLAMTLERAGKTDEALLAYDTALEVFPNYLPALQGKAMIQVSTGQFDESTRVMLSEIALRGDADWREWAQRQQGRRGMPDLPAPN